MNGERVCALVPILVGEDHVVEHVPLGVEQSDFGFTLGHGHGEDFAAVSDGDAPSFI